MSGKASISGDQTDERISGTFTFVLNVTGAAIDGNGHVNNVEFVRWMQDAAVGHADSVGCTAATIGAGATWVVRSHRVEYLRPAFEGDRVEVRTWVADFRRAFSKRKYEMVRCEQGGDETVLARGETEWVFVDVKTGRPRSVPEEVVKTFAEKT